MLMKTCEGKKVHEKKRKRIESGIIYKQILLYIPVTKDGNWLALPAWPTANASSSSHES